MTATTTTAAALDPAVVRQDFPVLARETNGHQLVYLDSAATSQKPRRVIDALTSYYERSNANIHRGVHRLSVEATDLFEGARDSAQRLLNAERREEIVFCRGSTEAINLVAQSFARPRLGPGDEVLITHMEHHSNIVPWQLVCEQTGATLKVAPIDDRGQLDMAAFASMLTERTKMVAVVHVSNALGTINPIREIVDAAHAKGIPVLVDGAQAVPHCPVDVRELGCDFYTVSGHKAFAPTGAGVLYGRFEHLDAMPPYQGGGEMILSVTFEGTVYNSVPHKFEAGTPDIAGVVGMGAAFEYLMDIGMDRVERAEAALLGYGTEALAQVPGLRMIGTADQKASVLSFVLGDIHPHDVGTILDSDGVAVRTGHHCAQPVMERFGLAATVRASLALYNTPGDIDRLVKALHKTIKVFG